MAGRRCASGGQCRRKEIEVDTAVASAWGDHHALTTAVAPEQALEPVVVPTMTDAISTVLGEHLLDVLVRLFGDEALVAPGVLNALVFDLADVVAVREHAVEVAERNRFGRMPARSPRP